MKLQGRTLTTGLKGQDVALLQSELAALHFSIAPTEIGDTSFGTTTRQAVLDFQKAQGLPTTGIVDEATATRINATLAEARGGAQQFVVQGHIHLKDGHAFDGVLVRAFDKDLRSEEPLGQAITIDGGSYHITYGPDLFRRADKNSADLIFRVF